jgi:molybdopterin converting factor small subunit
MSSSSTTTTTITILYFASASTATGKTTEKLAIPSTGLPLPSLPSLLLSHYPNNTSLPQVLSSSQWSINAEMIDDPSYVILKGGDEVAVIPPVSGG